MISALAGLVAGSMHVLSGPDHLAAIAPLAVDNRRKAWITGLRWGIGHSAGVLTVGLLSLLLRGFLPLHDISHWSERLVGVLLIAIGCWGIRKAMHVHAHEHDHNGEQHVHLHIHSPSRKHNAPQSHKHSHTAFGIGTLHGLAGSSHFLGVLPAMAFTPRLDAVAYLLTYGIGTVAAMTLFSSALATVANRLSLRTVAGYRTIMCMVSVGAVLVGGYWLFV